MTLLQRAILMLAGINVVFAAPLSSRESTYCDPSNIACGPVPGESDIYNNYTGKAAPFPGNISHPINATAEGEPGPDDLLFQNLLSAEWVIYSFYQTAVETFNASSFTALGLPNNTYQRIAQIRDNEAGHLRIFQDSISPTSMKPGPCKYQYGLTSPEYFLALQQLIEVSSESFLTGLVMQAKTNKTRGALVSIGEIESRHSSWSLIDVFNTDPFTGPAETVFPYANEILDTTNNFIVPGSCPPENPVYPTPRQNLPGMSFNPNTTTARPGSPITFEFSKQPEFEYGQEYHAVFFHGVQTVTMPFDLTTNQTTIPAEFDDKGLIIAVIADEPGAPTLESVVAGPIQILQQPGSVTLQLT